MKQLFFACALLLTATGAAAQNHYMARTGVYQEGERVVAENPRTVLAVNLTVEKETVLCGPYARYAQKFFGVRAPLTDKTTYTLKGAAVALAQNVAAASDASASVQQVLSHSRSEAEFARIQPDKTDMVTPALEDAARDAANAVFSLRKHRIELITGEAGENVFGAGLDAALREIERLEQDYLELFLGKRVVVTTSDPYIVSPKEGKKQYVLCRFSSDAGIVPDSDLSGEMVLLQIEPSGDTAYAYEASRKEVAAATYRIADPSECVVMCGNRVLTKAVLPVFEFGRTIHVALPRRK